MYRAAPPSREGARAFSFLLLGEQGPLTSRHSEERSDEESKMPREQNDTKKKDFRPLAPLGVTMERPSERGMSLLVGGG